MAIFPELIKALLRAFFVIAQKIHAETDEGAKGNKEEKITPHNSTSRMVGATAVA